jgi:hypothetical protein
MRKLLLIAGVAALAIPSLAAPSTTTRAVRPSTRIASTVRSANISTPARSPVRTPTWTG